MLIYNITVGVDATIEAEWLAWMKDVHIPKVMKTGKFVSHRILKVVTHDDPQSASYAIQYTAANLDLLQQYLEIDAPALRQEVQDKFGNKQASYRTILEEQ